MYITLEAVYSVNRVNGITITYTVDVNRWLRELIIAY